MSDLFKTGIRPAVDAYLKAKSEEVRSYGDYWSASSAGYCMRLNIMRRLGVPRVPELEDKASQTRVFEAGHIFHEWMQRITKDAGLSIASELELQDEKLMIRGHFDDLILIDGRLILMDYKTAHSASFKYSMGRPISQYHKMQLGTYLYMLRKTPRKRVVTDDGAFVLNWSPPENGDLTLADMPEDMSGLTEARILSISKDDLRMDEKQLLWTPKLEKEVYEYWSTLNGYWKAKKLPKCTCLDIEGGFMGKRSSKGKVYNDFYWEDEPCSLKWLAKCKEEGRVKAYETN